MTFASLTFKRTLRMITTSAGVTTRSGVRFPSLSSLSSETQQKVFLSFPRGRSSVGGDARRVKGGWWSSSSHSSRSAIRSLSGSHLSPNTNNNKPSSDLDTSYLPLYAADWARVDLPPDTDFQWRNIS